MPSLSDMTHDLKSRDSVAIFNLHRFQWVGLFRVQVQQETLSGNSRICFQLRKLECEWDRTWPLMLEVYTRSMVEGRKLRMFWRDWTWRFHTTPCELPISCVIFEVRVILGPALLAITFPNLYQWHNRTINHSHLFLFADDADICTHQFRLGLGDTWNLH